MGTEGSELMQGCCFECLEQRIELDFPRHLPRDEEEELPPFFIHGVSSSETALPWGNSAVIQIPSVDGNSIRFRLVRHVNSSSSPHSLSVYIDNFELEGSSDDGRPNGNVSPASSLRTTITSLAPFARFSSSCSYALLQQVANEYIAGSLEDHVLHSLCVSENVSNNPTTTSLRHPNLLPLLSFLKSSDSIYVLCPHSPLTLQSLLIYNPKHFLSPWRINFLFYQLLSAVDFLHSCGVADCNITPSSVMLNDSYWLWLSICERISSDPAHSGVCSCEGLYTELSLSHHLDWPTQFHRWWNGYLSNFEYLIILNRLAGRRWGDLSFDIVMPWVIDFSIKPDETTECGWRDLTKSKWRLAKGDEQLDFTYTSSEVPHHLSDECLSDLAVCSYKARRLPLSVLRRAVRSVYEPNEYPASMQRLYQWTPDECIPEFYCDPRVFYSLHPGMTDLAVPSWASSPEDFIKLHRDALESERVSRYIHHWIDITFGYKMSGEAAIAAKNVMLSSSELKIPRATGRRQLFTHPHPPRRMATGKMDDNLCRLPDVSCMQELEGAFKFSDSTMYFSPKYGTEQKKNSRDVSDSGESPRDFCGCKLYDVHEESPENVHPYDVNFSSILEHMDMDPNDYMGYQELLHWRRKSYSAPVGNMDCGKDLFSVGCVLAELCLKKPLFNATTLDNYNETGELPALIEELPPQTRVIVEACTNSDWTRRPTARSLLESPYFPSTVRLSYFFIAPLQLLAKDGTRLRYAANACKQGVLKAMGTSAAEMCAPYCLPLVMNAQSDLESEWAYEVLKEIIKRIRPVKVQSLVIPTIQKILQTAGNPHLKVLLLQSSLVQDLWKSIGKQGYLELLHPVIISVLSVAANKIPAAAASVLLICTSEDLGVPVTVNQTILPLIHCFGKGLCPDGIDALVRIGGVFGDVFIVKHMMPLLKRVFHFCINVSRVSKAEPVLSWCSLALADCLAAIDGLATLLPVEMVLRELIEDGVLLHKMVLMQANMGMSGLQVATSSLLAICQRIGPDLSASHILPQLKELFDEVAFSQDGSTPPDKSSRLPKSTLYAEKEFECRMDLVLIYPALASFLGIERLRQCCATWLLLEQYLLRFHGWKWECSPCVSENASSRRSSSINEPLSEYNPTKLLLNGVGWSIPQSQGSKSAKILTPRKQFLVADQSLVDARMSLASPSPREPWFWFPTAADSLEGSDFSSRSWSSKDELPWKIKASVIYSIRAYPGALRSVAVGEDECSVYTAGVGSGFKGTVQRWDLSRLNCMIGYYGHEEVVNDICELSSNGSLASCDGTIHVWNSLTGKAISVFSEPSFDASRVSLKMSSETLSNALFTSAFDGNLYTCMHQLKPSKLLVAGTDNGSVRFIDVCHGRSLHLWKGEHPESAFPPLVSALCSTGSGDSPAESAFSSPSWVAVGLSSGHCRLFDLRDGSVVASWKAHDGYITKMAAPDGNTLVSSSFDKTIRIWDLRRATPTQPLVLKGHGDGISGFSVWGHHIISICRNKIGLSAFRKFYQEDEQPQIMPRKLNFADQGTKNISPLTCIGILPFSRAFVVGTEDGYLRICC